MELICMEELSWVESICLADFVDGISMCGIF